MKTARRNCPKLRKKGGLDHLDQIGGKRKEKTTGHNWNLDFAKAYQSSRVARLGDANGPLERGVGPKGGKIQQGKEGKKNKRNWGVGLNTLGATPFFSKHEMTETNQYTST